MRSVLRSGSVNDWRQTPPALALPTVAPHVARPPTTATRTSTSKVFEPNGVSQPARRSLARVVVADSYPRRRHDRIEASPRRGRGVDRSLRRQIRVVAAAAPRRRIRVVAASSPRRRRGGAAASNPRHGRGVESAASSPRRRRRGVAATNLTHRAARRPPTVAWQNRPSTRSRTRARRRRCSSGATPSPRGSSRCTR